MRVITIPLVLISAAPLRGVVLDSSSMSNFTVYTTVAGPSLVPEEEVPTLASWEDWKRLTAAADDDDDGGGVVVVVKTGMWRIRSS